jgi:hypothetical protein
LSVNFESLSDVLKHRIRRKIILTLSDKGSISYVDLMSLAGITNTGKFNYHLKVLGDLIKKDESGKYSLSDKGQLAVQFLQKSVCKETELTPLPMTISTFSSRAFNLGQGFIWVVLVGPLIWVLFQWYLYLAQVRAFIGDPTIPLMILTLPIAGFFALFSLAAFPKIEIDRDGVVLKYGFVRLLFALGDVEIDPKGHVLKLGDGMWTYRLIPFRERECMDLLDRHVGTYQSKPLFLLYLLPFLILGLFFSFLRYLGGTFAPLFSAILWGAMTGISMAIFAYGAPVDMRINNLRRGSSAIVFGLSIGIVIFFLMFFSLQIH